MVADLIGQAGFAYVQLMAELTDQCEEVVNRTYRPSVEPFIGPFPVIPWDLVSPNAPIQQELHSVARRCQLLNRWQVCFGWYPPRDRCAWDTRNSSP